VRFFWFYYEGILILERSLITMFANRKSKIFFSLLTVILLAILTIGMGCSSPGQKDSTNNEGNNEANKEQLQAWTAPDGLEGDIVLATTTSTEDSGLLDVLLPVFEKKAKIKVKVVAVGTGQAIQLGKDGNADVLLVHSRKSEDAFVSEGFGSNAWDVMYNQFLIVGPAKDPAGISGTSDAVKALQAIAEKEAKFISRGDDSGTHKKENTLWEKAKISPKGNKWYISSGQGMGDTLRMADEVGGYTLTDEATFIAQKDLDLKIAVQGDELLFNPYGVIKVNSTKKPKAADAFISFITSPEGQDVINNFQQDGKTLFVPSAKQR
jgi:tungstate transport system substrate-binding protein